MNALDIQRVAVWWGPGIVILIIFGYGLLRLAHYWIEKSMEVKRQQMDGAYGLVRQYIEQFLGSQSSQADALSRLATSVEHRESQESFEHQEILVALKAMHRDIDSLRCRSDEAPCLLRAPAGFAERCSSLKRPAGLKPPAWLPEAAPSANPRAQAAEDHLPDSAAGNTSDAHIDNTI